MRNANEPSPSQTQADSQQAQGSQEGQVQQTDQTSAQTGQSQPQATFGGIDPNQLPKELRGIYKNMQADYTRKTQALAQERKELEGRLRKLEQQDVTMKEKSNLMDTLLEDTEFQQWLMNRRTGGTGQQAEGAELSIGDQIRLALGDEYEEADAIATLGEVLHQSLVEAVNNRLDERLGPVVQQAAQSARQTEFQALRDWAKDNNLEDPATYREVIDIYLRKYPTMTMRDAYNLARGSSENSLITRSALSRGATQPATSQGQPAGTGSETGTGEAAGTETPTVLMRPGGTGVTGGVSTRKSPLDRALELAGLRKEGKPSRGARGIDVKKYLQETIADMRSRGMDVSIDDLQR